MPTHTITQRLPSPLSRLTLLAAVRSSPALIAYVVIAIAWLLVAPRSPDLAAQFYRTYLFSHFGMVVWDNNWYGGHTVPGYSLLYPPLSTLVGVRLLGVLTVLASVVLFSRIASIVFGRRATLGVVFFAVAAAGDLWIGRITFALGVTFALASMLAMIGSRSRGRIALSCLLAALSAVASPVAGLMLALAFGTEIVVKRRLTPGTLVVAVVFIVLLPLEFAFREGGFEPYGSNSFIASTAVALGFLYALPRRERTLRIGGWLFLAANTLSLIPTPMGSNVVRYAVLLAGPLLLCALMRDDRGGGGVVQSQRPGARAPARLGESEKSPGGQGPLADAARRRWRRRVDPLAGVARRRWRRRVGPLADAARRRWRRRVDLLASLSPLRLPQRRPLPAVALVLVGIAFWVVWGPATQTAEVLKDPSTTASFYLPLRNFIATHARGRPVRIEVPFTRSHWESALLARYVPLARGWE
ncbi:MAG: hypothetical protein ACYCU0_13760, partial [Solirubrobacteraceae bacterium]